MKLKDYFFEAAGGHVFKLSTQHDYVIDQHMMLKLGAFIPDISLLADVSQEYDAQLIHRANDDVSLEMEGAVPVLSTPKSSVMLEDAFHLMAAFIRKDVMEARGTPFIHGACVGKGDAYQLIVGHSGSGKTTLAQKLVDEANFQLFSGNKTVLAFEKAAGLRAAAGTKTMTALDADLNRYAYRLSEAQYSEQSCVSIQDINIVKINDGISEVEELSPLSALHTLYPYVMDAVNCDVIVGGRFLFDGGLSSNMKEQIVSDLSKSLEHVRVRKISGSVPFIMGQLKNG